MLKEFKTFMAQGNVLDLAVGVIIGGSFGKIVTSMVDDLIMPIINLITNGGISGGIILREQMIDAAGKDIPAIAIKYGNFLSTVLNFIIIAWVIFLVVKAANKMRLTEK
jgi:large conductance mechanosensitive channel